MSTNRPELDLDSITRAINNDYDRSAGLEGYGNTPATPEPEFVAPEPQQAPSEVNIEPPFLIIDFVRSEEDPSILSSFRLFPDGIDSTPESMIAHLEMVIHNMKEALAQEQAQG